MHWLLIPYIHPTFYSLPNMGPDVHSQCAVVTTQRIWRSSNRLVWLESVVLSYRRLCPLPPSARSDTGYSLLKMGRQCSCELGKMQCCSWSGMYSICQTVMLCAVERYILNSCTKLQITMLMSLQFTLPLLENPSRNEWTQLLPIKDDTLSR